MGIITIRKAKKEALKLKHKKYLFLCITCFLFAFILITATVRRGKEELASRIAPDILRFHVLANSNSAEDQELKLNVRTMLLNTIYDAIGDSATKQDTRDYILSHSSQLETVAEAFIQKSGFSYPVHIEVAETYFPTKVYGDMVFPCGTYDAVRVLIGSGEGKNWWCVLYPPLCFVDAAYAEVPDTSKDYLKQVLADEDYRKLTNKQEEQIKINIRLQFLDKINGRH